jgi:polyisoprenoid-binding protein YceI
MRAGTAISIATGLALVFLAGPQPARAQAATAVPTASAAKDTKWVVDMVHSQVEFSVRHLVGRVRGTFTRWYAMLTTKGRDWKQGSVDVSVQTASLSTGNSYRDADLRSERFFDVARFPKMTFQGTGFSVIDSTVEVAGILTIRDKSKPIILTGLYRGIAEDPEGHERIAFEASTVVNRRDFGITYSQAVGGTDLIGNDVEITVGIEAVRIN